MKSAVKQIEALLGIDSLYCKKCWEKLKQDVEFIDIIQFKNHLKNAHNDVPSKDPDILRFGYYIHKRENRWR